METGPFLLVTNAPLDGHTADLLREFTPTDEIVTEAGTPAQTLHQWAQAARRCAGRLVVVDSQLRAEANALANLLDAPDLGTAVLLAHNGDDDANPAVRVLDDVLVTDGGAEHAAAGIFVVANDRCQAFADALDRTAQRLPARRGAGGAWELALTALTGVTTVRAVPADPFCASRVAMDLPELSEEDRRLRATAAEGDDPLTTAIVRPVSRRVTGRVLAAGRTSEHLTAAGLGLGVLASILAIPGGLVSWILAGIALLAANVALLSDGEIARYRRRSSPRGQRLHRLAARIVEVTVTFGLAIATARAGTPSWLLTTATIGLLAVLASAVTSRAASGDGVPDFRALRWLVVALTLMVAGPGYALLAFALGALGVIAVVTVRALGSPRGPIELVQRSGRFLHPPGSFTDSGVPVRVISSTVGAGASNLAGRVFGAGLALIGFTTVWSWGGSSWPILIGVVVFVGASAVAFAGPLRGVGAWAVPPLLRGVELAVLVAVASTSTGAGRVAAALTMTGIYLLTTETGDRWRFRRLAPPAWLPLVGLGFDGRLLLVATASVIGATASATVMWVLAAVLMSLWAFSVATSARQPRGA
ncbi:MAG: hypothetical protein QG597_1585 [Actinomycetota bacterium]|nr:hypothetical protein [Actinomycetota bacterium]